MLRRDILHSLPAFIKIETSRFCNLKCPSCPHSTIKYNIDNNNYNLNIDNVKKIIEPIHKSVLLTTLSLQGEPLCNDKLPEIINYIHSKGIGTSFPTNLCLNFSNDKLKKLILSGIDTIYVSLDGATEETYSKYRRGGDFNLVLDNVKSLCYMKNKLKKRKPKIVWKFIVFPHNKHEVEYVRNNYRRLGFDSYHFVYDEYSKEKHYLEKKIKYKQNRYKKKKACFWLWMTTIINYKCTVHPCTNQDHDLGNCLSQDLKIIWNNNSYRRLRFGFNRKNFGDHLDERCFKCQCPSYAK